MSRVSNKRCYSGARYAFRTNHCWYCGTRLLRHGECKQYHPQRRTLDHVVPVSQGGRGVGRNIVPACYSCNQSKRNMGLEQFRVTKGGHREYRFWGEMALRFEMADNTETTVRPLGTKKALGE